VKRCLFCGQLNPDTASACNCGSSDLEIVEPVDNPPESPSPTPVKQPSLSVLGGIKTYLVPAILATLFCCTPLGIVAIVYASKVSAKRESGDMQGAIAASQEARKWCWISFGLGIFFWIIMMVIGNIK
jgi:hypothetical protein